MANPNLALLEEAAVKLGELLDELVLVGGCAAGLLVTDPGSSPIRPTVDVDLVVEAATYTDYHVFGQRLSARGFQPGGRLGDPLCRWRNDALVIDVMPLDESVLGFSNRWYRAAIQEPSRAELPSGRELAHIDAPHFLATKLEAFSSRGEGDFLASTDLEDVVVVVDGRTSIDKELGASEPRLRGFVAEGIAALLAKRHFVEAVPGYFAGQGDVARRIRLLMDRLHELSRLS